MPTTICPQCHRDWLAATATPTLCPHCGAPASGAQRAASASLGRRNGEEKLVPELVAVAQGAADPALISDLLLLWQEVRTKGRDLSAEELCAGRADLASCDKGGT